ncbi:zinc finger protein on ecdysone puffs [Battus philenor]|uniref:zinc finger protein on ecdysone puffs n=1 Tax=Battus philenor TaxID=42288 RepID=UPI0035D0DCB5
MSTRRSQNGVRRMDYVRNDRPKNFGRSGVSPWQGAGPGGGIPNLLPLGGGSTEATLALASNIINLLQPRQNPVPSLLDMPIRRDFGPNMGRYDRGYGPNRMGNQGNFRRTGNYNRAGERINTNRKPFRPNEGQRHQNKNSPKKDADSKAKPVKESEQDSEEREDGGEKGEGADEQKNDYPKTRYDDLNTQLLKCHICNKSMWDGRSFENHLSGRAHAIMMQKTAESYALTADTMRQEFKIREMKRTRKAGQQPPRDFYCAMCDMYAADGAIHRTTVGHRKLKKYLHPTCTSCHKEMPTRIELDEHRLTAEHLRNMQDKQEVVSKPKPEVMVISTLTMEQSYLRDDRERWRRPERQDREKEAEDTVKEEKKDDQEDTEMKEKTEEETEGKTEETEAKKEDEINIDNENTILDYKEGDDLSNVTPDKLPVYSTERGVGRSFLTEFRCVQCRLCRKLLDSEETAEVHLKTWRHHQLFLRLISKNNQQTQEGGKRPINAEESGNWKRRKTSRDDNGTEEDRDHEMEQEVEQQQNGDDREAVVKQEKVEEEAETKPAADVEVNAGDEDLEDWEQSIDEILNDEKASAESEEKSQAEGDNQTEGEKKEEEKETQSSLDKANEPKTYRGRGRGRRRY